MTKAYILPKGVGAYNNSYSWLCVMRGLQMLSISMVLADQLRCYLIPHSHHICLLFLPYYEEVGLYCRTMWMVH